jgi:hypothetical protein
MGAEVQGRLVSCPLQPVSSDMPTPSLSISLPLYADDIALVATSYKLLLLTSYLQTYVKASALGTGLRE